MLTYEEFKNTFCVQYPEVMGSEFDGYEMKLMPVVKRGRTLDGFTFCRKLDEKRVTAMPTFYFNELYESYCDNQDMAVCIEQTAESMKSALIKGDAISCNVKISKIKKNVIAELVNPEIASPYLYNVPHREFLNLYIIYRWVVNVDESGVYSGIIDNDLMNSVELTEDELYENALKNTRRIIIPQIKPFDTVVRKLLRRDGRSEYEIRKFIGKIEPDERMWILTNKHHFRGSTTLLFSDFLDKVAQKVGDDFYIIPTSVNESMAVSVRSSLTPDKMLEMLCDSNNAYFNDDDQMLSETIYYYSVKDKTLSVFDVGEVRV